MSTKTQCIKHIEMRLQQKQISVVIKDSVYGNIHTYHLELQPDIANTKQICQLIQYIQLFDYRYTSIQIQVDSFFAKQKKQLMLLVEELKIPVVFKEY